MKQLLAAICTSLLLGLGTVPASAADGPWSTTLYAGPFTTHWASQILAGEFVADGGMAGLAVDGRLVELGGGISIGTEIHVTQYWGKYPLTTGGIGIGLRMDQFPWSRHLRTTLAVYTGPSYASKAAFYGPPFNYKAPRLLNYVGAELGFGIPGTKSDLVLRLYHRSAVWTVYGDNFDAGTMFGVGFRRRF